MHQGRKVNFSTFSDSVGAYLHGEVGSVPITSAFY